MPFERPRVRAEGPGGPDIKQGARIACLDCRSAKIRCSAPTDGKVPCKRCARHGRECLFEKHRRGRKPGRTNNARPDINGLHSMGGSGGSSGSGSERGVSMGLAHAGERDQQYHGSSDGYISTSTAGTSHMYRSSGGHNVNVSPKLGVGMQHPPYMPPNPHHNASSSSYAHHSSSSSTSSNSGGGWRAPLSSDDPRLISPRHNAVRSLPSHHMPASSPSSSSVAPYGKASATSTSPQLRDARHAHPSYLPFGPGTSSTTSNGPNSHVTLKTSPASPFQPLPYGTKYFESSQMDLPFSSNGSMRYTGGHSHAHFTDGGSRSKQDDEHTRGSSSSSSGLSFGNMSRFSEPSSFSPPSSGLPPSSLGSGTTPGRSWLDLPTPGTRSLLSPSHLMTTSIGTFPASGGGLPTAWPGSAITSPHNKRRGGPTDYFAGALPLVSTSAQDPTRYNSNSRHEPVINGAGVSPSSSEVRKRQRVEDEQHADESRSESRASADDSSRLAETKSNADEEEDEENIDHMDEDEVGGAHDGDVLSTPLRLLAHASDAALAIRRAKGDTDGGSSSQRSTSHGAATMGLVSHPVPSLPSSSKWFDSGRLPNMSQSDARVGNTRGGLLPRLTSVAQRRDLQRSAALASTYDSAKRDVLPTNFAARAASALPPPSLNTIGRSRSYTAVETASLARASFMRSSEEAVRDRSPPIVATSVTHSERRAEVLGIRTDAEGRQIEVNTTLGAGSGNVGNSGQENSVTPSTLDPDAWEYRDGRVRSRKSISAGPGTSNGTGSTPTEEENLGTARRQSDGVVAAKSGSADDDSSAIGPGESSVEAKSTFRARLGSMDAKPRWEIVRRRASKPGLGLTAGSVSASSAIASALGETQSDDGGSSSDESEKLGASHQDFFSMSIFHSKMDNDFDLDPVRIGLIQLRELERLFDIFFARVNPLLTIFDPFLHSVTYVRNRSALLTTVIAALAARLSDTGRHAKLAVVLENHWRQKLLPEALLGGYKSVELAQAFLVLAIYHKPTNRLSEDRSWQYLGFAIRIATEIGVNRLTQPSDEVKENEQVRRRMRNRTRLWISLWLTDRSLSLQTGRLHTISEDDLIQRSDLWHREDFAMPEDARLVSSVKLMRIVTNACIVLADVVGQHSAALVQDQLILPSEAAIMQSQESIKSLTFRRIQAISELDRWKDIWCAEVLDESSDGIQSLAIGTSLVKWRPRALIDLLYARLHLNSIVLEAMERHLRLVLAASTSISAASSSSEPAFKTQFDETEQMSNKVALDCWDTSLRMIDMLLNDVPEEDLAAGPNALAINVIYGAMAALRLSNAYKNTPHGAEWASREAIVARCKALAEALIRAGRTPEHRNGAAAPFGAYLKSIVTLWESENVGLTSGSREKRDPAGSNVSATVAMENKDCKNMHDDASVAQPSTLSSNSPSQQAEGAAASAVRAANDVVQQQPLRNSVTDQISTSPRSSSKVNVAAEQQQQQQQQQQQPSTPSLLLQQHSVGDEIWGASFASSSRHNRSTSTQQTEADSMDRMWDYLTTYPDSGTTFPMSLWQPQINSGTPNLGFGAILPAMGAGAAPLVDVPIEAGPSSSAAVNAAATVAANIALSMTSVVHPSAV